MGLIRFMELLKNFEINSKPANIGSSTHELFPTVRDKRESYYIYITGILQWKSEGTDSHSGGWSLNWIHSTRRPLNGLLYLPRVIMTMENLVESRLAGETGVLGENLPQSHFVHHKSHLTRPGLEPGPPRWEASD
jgi:hypothetical protein